MKELTLQEIKEVELGILKKFRAFCEENNIKYYIAHGTLLGAIRYKKFIPWDDDIDVLVPREDYNRLISIFEDGEQYRLFAFEKNQEYRYPFAKLCDMTTLKKESSYNNGIVLGVDMDIFPLDLWDNDLKNAKREAKYINKNMFYLGLSKLKKPSSRSLIKLIIKGFMMLFCKILGSKHFIRNILKESYKETQKESAYKGCKAWCVYGERGIIPAEVFAETIDLEFEGEYFPAPKDYDTYLRCLFGDYMPEPPKEKQKTHHNFKAYRL